MLLWLFYMRALLVASEIAICEAQSHDRATEAIAICALEIETRLHNGTGKGRAVTLTISTYSANWRGAVTCLACALNLDEAIHGAIVVEAGHPARAIKAGVAK